MNMVSGGCVGGNGAGCESGSCDRGGDGGGWFWLYAGRIGGVFGDCGGEEIAYCLWWWCLIIILKVLLV